MVVTLVWDIVGLSPLKTVNSVVAPMFASAAAALFAIGFTLPVWGVRLSMATSWMADYRAFWRRYPLWQAITPTFPEVVLVPPPASRLELAREPAFFQGCQVIEILDGELRLRPLFRAVTRDVTRPLCAEHHITGARADALEDAVQIAAALRAHTAGKEAPQQAEYKSDSADGDLGKEAVRMVHVADAFRAFPPRPGCPRPSHTTCRRQTN
ncbi:DUF6545 domain-containing protein [Streptomyces massasporeus]